MGDVPKISAGASATAPVPNPCAPSPIPRGAGSYTSFVHEQRLARIKSQGYCGEGSIVGVDPTGTRVIVIPIFCKSWDCPICGPMKRDIWIGRFLSGHPTHSMTLTSYLRKGADPRAQCRLAKAAWSRLVEDIREKFGPIEYALVWELTKKGAPHAHILYRGPYIPQRWLSLRWATLGIGRVVHLKRIKDARLEVLHSCKYLGKDFGQSAEAIAPLRVVQLSTGYELQYEYLEPKGSYDDWTWTRVPTPRNEVLRQLATTEIPFTSAHRRDSAVELEYQSKVSVVEFYKADLNDFYYSIAVRTSPDSQTCFDERRSHDVATGPQLLPDRRQSLLHLQRD